jgi:hypothetical protein
MPLEKTITAARQTLAITVITEASNRLRLKRL